MQDAVPRLSAFLPSDTVTPSQVRLLQASGPSVLGSSCSIAQSTIDKDTPCSPLAWSLFKFPACGSSADRAQSYYEHGMKLLAAHDNQRAAIEFRNAIKLKKDLMPAWRGLAQIEELNHHWQGLVPILATIVELDPKDVETKLKLASLCS